jgi:phosphoribosylamine---glycine ligase
MPATGKRVLLVGSGAREHALASALVSEGASVLSAPGNAGLASLGEAFPIPTDDLGALVELAVKERVDLVVVGPELPLVRGLVDALGARGILAFGPNQQAAELEGSKCFMKRFLSRHAIPTAAFEIFDDADQATAYVRAAGRPLVVKADGLAAGKGVVVAKSADEAVAAIDRMMRAREFGDAGARVVIEELLPGEEASFHVIVCGGSAVPLAPAQDHKRVRDGDEGPNTGGMGAYAPAPVVTAAVHERVMATIVGPTLAGFAADGIAFQGVLFVGLMIEDGVPRVLEFNVRFGDPETSVLVALYGGSWFDLLESTARGGPVLAAPSKEGAAIAIVLAADGYPATPRVGDAISGLDVALPPGVAIYHAGTKRAPDGAIVTAGGRVLNVAASGSSLREAAAKAYAAVEGVRFHGAHHRTDIGHRALGR